MNLQDAKEKQLIEIGRKAAKLNRDARARSLILQTMQNSLYYLYLSSFIQPLQPVLRGKSLIFYIQLIGIGISTKIRETHGSGFLIVHTSWKNSLQVQNWVSYPLVPSNQFDFPAKHIFMLCSVTDINTNKCSNQRIPLQSAVNKQILIMCIKGCHKGTTNAAQRMG